MKTMWRNRKLMAAALGVIVLGFAAAALARSCTKEKADAFPMEATRPSIEAVRLRGSVYVCSAMIEDYAVERAIEKNLFWLDEEHSCVQTLKQKCSYRINLDKVEYRTNDSTKMVRVKLPAIEYVATTQSSSFLSDDSNYWAQRLPNTNGMKRKVEMQIRKRFDTSSNRRAAERYAEDAISEMLEKLGYEVEFVRALERKRE